MRGTMKGVMNDSTKVSINKRINSALLKCRWLIGFVIAIAALQAHCLAIELKMLANGSALLMIEGTKHFMHDGEKSPEGVLLVSANSQFAIIEYKGERKKIEMSHNVSTQFKKSEKKEVRIPSSAGNHYQLKGYINGLMVDFMVDTGATSIAMNHHDAERLGIDYRAGKEIPISTANGIVTSYLIILASVRVGTIELKQIPAVVSPSDFPQEVLLGNTYLSKVDIKIDQGVLVLTEK